VVLSILICARTGTHPAAGLGKQLTSVLLYLGAIPMAWISPYISLGMIAVVAVLWLLPPRRIVEQTRAQHHDRETVS
jgi:hypothetical protein